MKKVIFASLLMCLTLAVAGTASAQTERFEGHWRNVNDRTRGIVEINIHVHGTDVDVKALGACEPTPCDVGNVDAHVYASSVEGNLAMTARAIIATYRTKFEVKTLVIQFRGDDELFVEEYTHFTDGSGRSPYVMDETFRRRHDDHDRDRDRDRDRRDDH